MARNFRKKNKNRFFLYLIFLFVIASIIFITYILTEYGETKKHPEKTPPTEKKEYDKISKTFIEDFLFFNNIDFNEKIKKGYVQFKIKVKENQENIIKDKLKIYNAKRGYVIKTEEINKKREKWLIYKKNDLQIEILVEILEVEPKTIHKKALATIIIDDIGNNKEILDEIVKINYKFALSILPNSYFNRYSMDKGAENKKEIMLHLPLEPIKANGKNLDLRGFLLVNMRNELLENYTQEYLDMIPKAKGVNNHTGSLFTQQENKMRVVLQILKRNNKFFIDSKTTGKSLAYKLAGKMGLENGVRDVFLDGENEKMTLLNFRHLFSIARQKGKAIGIAHPKRTTIDIMKNHVKELSEKYNIKLVYPSEVVKK